ncbi:MAG: TonB-dependent receptor [Rubrivivax sp.]|nr:MAG: TonB-dependent receptor [Rubrivivax sp.]
MKQLHVVPKKRILTSALLLALANPVYAQVADETVETPAASTAEQDAKTLDTVVVTGIRGSLTSSMNLKRDARGIVDGIVAEDIGKFPDTNLAESLQRISGVSIDRSMGEGSKVTVRGVGPDFNLVLLHGRQMPASSNAGGAGVSNSRAFDFANLASESISGVDVYKTSRADTPPGGIGATINIKTARPLDTRVTVASVGVKLVKDQSASRLPEHLKGQSVTPEISAIYSSVFADGKFGVAVTGSYQRRDLGYNQANVGNGWHTIPANGGGWGEIAAGSTADNRPTGADTVYSTPQSIGYSMTGVKRERTNGQLTLQYAPTKEFTATLDHTYSENKLKSTRSDISAWFGFGKSYTKWTDGPAAAPLIYSEIIDGAGTGDVAMGSGEFAVRNTNHSTGLNLAWKPSAALKLELDAHHSTAVSKPDSPYGSNAVQGSAVFSRGTTTVDFSQDFPVWSMPGATTDVSKQLATGSSYRSGYMKAKIDQVQARGNYKFSDSSNLDFGVTLTDAKNRSAFAVNENGSWGGIATPADYPDSIFKPDTISKYFPTLPGSGNPAMFNNINFFDFKALNAAAAKLDPNGKYLAPTGYTQDGSADRHTTEKSQSLYAQFNTEWDWIVPVGAALGLRYERTKVNSAALVPTATGISWRSFNEFSLTNGPASFTELKGKYSYVLPSLDIDFEVTRDTKLRASYGESIGRPGWGDIQGGQVLSEVRAGGGSGSQGDPNLKPLKSKNFDLSLEHYFGKGAYIAAGLFRKEISNYIGNTIVKGTPFNLHTPIGGALFKEALGSGCAATDNPCIRNWIFQNRASSPGVTRGEKDSQGNWQGTIVGQPGDPIAVFDITVPANQRDDHINGMELNAQYAFRNGFGFSANYTYVKSGLKYIDNKIGDQFALEGLSNSGNLVGFYEDDKLSARIAYNWRGKYLAGRHDGREPNPIYVAPYGQFDVGIGYTITEKLSVQLDAVNLTDEYQRAYERNERILQAITQTGRRFMIGARYKF